MKHSEKTILPYPVISELFKNVLLSGQPEKGNEDFRPNEIPKLLKILAVIKTEGSEIPSSQIHFFSNIMAACKLSHDAYIALPEKSNQALDYLDIKAKYQVPIVMLFGIEPAGINLPIHFPMFQIQSFQGCQYLWAPALDILEQDKSLKLQLWQSLKKMFP